MQCTVKPLFFFFHTKSQPFNKKQPIGTINQIKQSERTIQKTNLQNKHDKPSHQSNVKSITKKPQQTTHTISQSKTRPKQTQQAITTKCNVFEYYNIANSNGFRANRKYAFYKNSTQIHKTKQHNLYFEVTILQTRKSKTLYFLIIGNSQENIFNLE